MPPVLFLVFARVVVGCPFLVPLTVAGESPSAGRGLGGLDLPAVLLFAGLAFTCVAFSGFIGGIAVIIGRCRRATVAITAVIIEETEDVR